jgi:hypothetical protein
LWGKSHFKFQNSNTLSVTPDFSKDDSTTICGLFQISKKRALQMQKLALKILVLSELIGVLNTRSVRALGDT